MKSCPACLSTYPSHISFCPSDGNALMEFQEWTEGTVVRGKYRILNRVGQGGMGSVYKAIHLGFQELRALKVLNRELMNDPRFHGRFKQEAFTARKLVHPNVVRVEDIDESDDGHPFIAMEFIEGENLGHLIEKEGALPWRRTCSIVKQIASALDFAHRLGVIHRDIKPHNVALVAGRGLSQNGSLAEPASGQKEEVKVLDFGIAKLREAYAEGKPGTLTQTGLIVGTPQYMSPEQAKGKRGDDLDGRSDIYSLGVVMYQMLTGALPFEATTTVEMLVAHLQENPRPLHAIRPDLQIPEPIAQIVMQCLEKSRDLRPPTGNALIQAIESAEDAIAVGTLSSLRAAQTNPIPAVEVSAPPPPPMLAIPAMELGAASQLVPALEARPASQVVPASEVSTVTQPAPAVEFNAASQPSASVADSQNIPSPVTPVVNLPISRERAKPPKTAKPPVWLRWATSFVGVAVVITISLLVVRHRTGAQPPQKQAEVQPSQAVHNADDSSTSAPVLTPVAQDQNNAQAVVGPTPVPVPEEDRPANADLSDAQSNSGSQSSEAPLFPSHPSLSRAPSRSLSRADQRSALEKQIYAAITEGDAACESGEYDGAIRAYREGLKLDPKNKVLIHRIETAQRAKSAEESANQ